MPKQSDLTEQLVWDKVTRLWHWALATSVIAGWLLGEFRDFQTVEWHFYAGYATAGLLVWRCIWGLIGPQAIRFSTLALSIKSAPRYLKSITKRTPSGLAGHNPLGSLSIFAFLISLSTQVLTGIFLEDDAFFAEGPVAYMVGSDTRSILNTVHHYNSSVLLVLLGLHLAAIAFYAYWKKENLLLPMFTGKKWVGKK